MSSPTLDLDLLLKLRVLVARFGEMDIATWRVVPKCVTDRSLAIAHGLENVFWVEGTDGKWTARKTPTRTVDELVKERTSFAVKAALKNLREAPVASGPASKTKKATRRGNLNA